MTLEGQLYRCLWSETVKQPACLDLRRLQVIERLMITGALSSPPLISRSVGNLNSSIRLRVLPPSSDIISFNGSSTAKATFICRWLWMWSEFSTIYCWLTCPSSNGRFLPLQSSLRTGNGAMALGGRTTKSLWTFSKTWDYLTATKTLSSTSAPWMASGTVRPPSTSRVARCQTREMKTDVLISPPGSSCPNKQTRCS